MCAFEFYNATNIFLKSIHKVYPGEIQNVSTAVFSHKLKKTNEKQTKLSPFSFNDVYHSFYSCCSDTRVLVNEVIPYNLLDISDS